MDSTEIRLKSHQDVRNAVELSLGCKPLSGKQDELAFTNPRLQVNIRDVHFAFSGNYLQYKPRRDS